MKISVKLTLYLAVFLFLMNGAIQARELRIVGVPAPPMRYLDENNVLRGFDIEVIDYIFKQQLGLEYTVKLIDSSPRIETEWKRGSFDVLLTYSYKESRAEYLIYPTQSHVNVSWHLFILKENVGKIAFETYSDLEGLTIGVSDGKSYSPEFWEASQTIFSIDSMAKDSLQINKLLGRRFDAVPLETASALYKAIVGGYLDRIAYLERPVAQKAYYNLFVKASDYPDLPQLVEDYDAILDSMKKDGTLESILTRYGLTVD